MSKRKFSIVIPTYDSEATLRNCLASLFRQKLKSIEVIVVDGGSKDRTRDIASDFRDVVLIRNKISHYPGSSRNLGAEQAEGDTILFLDSDCRAHRMLLTYHEKAFYVTRRCDGVQGVLRSAHNDALSRAIESQFLTQYWIDNLREDGTTRFYSAAVSNLSLDKQVFLENKFSEDLSSCDDIELFMKLRRKRARVIFEPRAVAYHPHPRNLRDLFDQRKWYGQGFVELNKKYPNVRFRKTSMFGTSKRYLTAPEHELFHMVKEDHRALCHGCPLELCRIVSKKLPTRQEMNSKYLRQITCLGFAAGILRERVGLDYDWTM